MAYGKSASPFLLKEGVIWVGSYSSISYTDPEANFTGDILGYHKMGTINFGLSRKYAEARSGTPSKIIRKDLIQKDFMIEFESFQVNVDLFKLLMGLDQVNNAGLGLDNMFIGTDEPTQSNYGILVKGYLTSGKQFKAGMWYGKDTSEDISLKLSGTDYATTKAKFEAFESPNITTNDARNLGYFQIYT
jgi:hypothetical protein